MLTGISCTVREDVTRATLRDFLTGERDREELKFRAVIASSALFRVMRSEMVDFRAREAEAASRHLLR